jgi:ubiquinone/menaquinone biosynthesis C-methylase UbiE
MKESPNGYTEETAQKYTEGQKQFFDIDKVLDGATVVMEAEITALAQKYSIHTVCDIGCGSNCVYLQKWKSAAEAKRLVGVEPSLHMRSILESDLNTLEHTEDIEVVSGDWENIPLPDGSVDLAVSRFSLHHLQNIADGYREIVRVLKHEGYAVISLPHPEYCARELEKQGVVTEEGIPMSVQVFDTSLHYYYHDLDTYLGENLSHAGLELVTHKSFNWGTKDEADKKVPNTLLFVLKKL